MNNVPAGGPLHVLMLALVRVSGACLAAGLVIWFFQRDSDLASSLLNGGIVLLMATPILRILMSAIGAVRVRDWVHVGTIVAVALLLALTLTFAARG